MPKITLTVAKVGESLFEGEAISITVPGSAGEMTVLASHEPIVSTLSRGEIRIRTESGIDVRHMIEGGVIEANKSRVVVLL